MTRPGPVLALMPGTRKAPGTGANTGPYIHPELADERIFAGLHHAGYHAWLDHIWPAAACTRPIRLRGDIKHIDAATGELLRTIPTIGMPDGSIYKACGNRRATTCPGCAETYRRDAYHLLRAGLIGGKSVTPDVAGHPAVFVTFTAPSFGPVHARPVRQHTCADRSRCTCRPQPCHARRNPGRCPHGRHDACFTRHRPGDPKLGQPLCPDCYDYPAHVVWNNAAGELWRRTKQAIERRLGQLARRRGVTPIWVPCGDGKYRLVDPVRVAHGKAAEYQARGAVHFHALLRLDGYDPDHPDQILPPPSVLTISDLDDAIRWAAQAISYRTPDHPARPGGWPITWGTQLDIRVITLAGTGRPRPTWPSPATWPSTPPRAPRSPATPPPASPPTTSTCTPTRTAPTPNGSSPPAGRLGADPGYIGLRRWAHMLGFGGHFLTKARRYSVRFADLRQARITYRRGQDPGPEHGPIRTADHTDDETTLIIGTFSFAGTGWKTSGDALLANTAADQARKRRQAGRDELADEYDREHDQPGRVKRAPQS